MLDWTEIKNIVTHIDWQQFHFLRPKALLLFYPMAVIVILLIISNKERKKWKKLIAPALRPYMFTRSSPWAVIMPLLIFIIGTSCIIFGVAGPTWKKKEIPGEKVQAVVLIILDVSRSMLAGDIQPNRLERAKFKINDFLDANPRAKVGLMAYAGSAHPVLPFTGDYHIVKHQAVSLANRIMPIQGSNTKVMLQWVDQMMQRVTAPSTILLMTDDISSDDAAQLSNYMQHSIHKLNIMLFSSPSGARVPGFAKVLSKQDPTVIANLTQDTSIIVTPITLDKSDVQSIATQVNKHLIFEKDKKTDDKDWDDMGWLLIMPAVVVGAFWFRKGWVIQWCWLLPAILMLNSCGVKSSHPDWWYSKDYQGQLLNNAHRYNEAAETFDDDQHKAVAYYKAGNYSAAADLFALDTTANGQYNRGLALAQLGRYDDAVAAFDKAVSLDASLKGKVATSIEHAKDKKHEVDSVNRFQKNQDKMLAKIDARVKKKSKQEPLKERKAETDDEKLSSDTRVKKMPKFGNRVTDEVQSTIHMAKEAGKPTPPGKKVNTSDKLASNILLRKTDADPGEFLHKRFQLQLRRYYKKIDKAKNPW